MAIITQAELAAFLGKSTPLAIGEASLFNLAVAAAEQEVYRFVGVDFAGATVTELLPVVGRPSAPSDDLDPERIAGRIVFSPSRGDMAGADVLYLSRPPVLLAGLTIWEDAGAMGGQAAGAFGAGSQLTLGSDYFLDVAEPAAEVPISRSGAVYRFGSWSQTPRTIKATYTSGATAEWLALNSPGLKFATLQTAANAYRTIETIQLGKGPVVSENIGDYSYATSPAAAAAMLGGGGPMIPPAAQQSLLRFRNYSAFL